MKTLYIISAAILAVLLWGVISYRTNAHEAEIERQQQVLSDCWVNAVANGTGGAVCKDLADQLNK